VGGRRRSDANLGLSQNFATNRRPSVGLLHAVIPGAISINPTTGVPTSTPATFMPVPVVAWDSGGIFVSAFYPGAPAIPPNANDALGNPQPNGLPAVPAGWYQLNLTSGGAVTNTFGAAGIGLGENASLVVDAANQVTVAWDGILGAGAAANFEIMASRWTIQDPLFRSMISLLVYPGKSSACRSTSLIRSYKSLDEQ